MADIEIRQESPTAFYIKVHDTDNVAIIVNDNGLKAGTRFPDGLELIEHIPKGIKSLVDIPEHGEIIRYGEVIGYAVRDIRRAAGLMNPGCCRSAAAEHAAAGDQSAGAAAAAGRLYLRRLSQRRRQRRHQKPARHSTSVHCVAGVVDYVVKIIERDLLPKYPNVDGVVGLNHLYGCGVAINAPAAVVPFAPFIISR
jgi:galactarate dehydratase